MRHWSVALALGILGAVAGLAYGWFVAPVQYVNTTPASLRIDYRADYVLMVAERFSADHDLDLASRRLAIFGEQQPGALVSEALEFGRQSSYAPADLEALAELLRAVPTLRGGPETEDTSP